MSVTYEEEKLILYGAIGYATTQWSHVEYGLAMLAVTCQQPDEPAAAFRAFRAVENFRSKLGFTDAAVKGSRFASIIGTQWATAHKTVKALSTVRNQIAHDRLVGFSDAPIGRRYLLVNKDSNLAVSGTPSDAIGARRIHQAGEQFSRAASLLHDIVDLAVGLEPTRGETAPQEREAPQMAQLARRMREAFVPR